ncbi:FMN-linked oxidoreductase [Glarea lozoyensis ATCC 20868]|uniref:L-lactate dehydrogenase (cytochrome) n=1 Tax=Glarea lozoyensis (strain ATCC 20868 / MF5171) TaxID=1116229 RepID=S3CWR5_GLAL2|nr:FMN-linked oxidoreductase [Glarea lozoyensis ATCC 20868]EPE30100.1 FMN-linked oxidoreductase [Glarea lozoyensis ATCC 20868]
MSRSITTQEISKHNTSDDLWIVVDNTVYDLTEFAPSHPGGAAIIQNYAGRDATTAYSTIHAPSLISTSLSPSKILGTLDLTNLDEEWLKPPPQVSKSTSPETKPPLSTLISTHDFVSSARLSLTPKTWAFYSSAATDCLTKSRNNSIYGEIGLRPRCLVNVKDVDTSTTMLGHQMRVPIFCAPASMAKLVHPAGELGIARGCKKVGIPQVVSTSASYPIKEIVESTREEGTYGGFENEEMPLFFQLYVDKERHKSEALLAHVESLGVKAIFVTVDAPIPGKREADERVAADESVVTPMSGVKAKNDSKGGALGRIMGRYIDASLSWDDLPWLRKSTNLPIVLKGVQNYMDAKLAMENGIQGIVLSNHGGRSLDTAPPPILVLLELQRNCPEVFDALDIFIDGGIMRGTDIFKCLCLGATSVGIGRGFLYALNYGEEGVEKFVDILKDELETTMKMMGVTDLSQVHPGMVNTRAVDHLVPVGEEHPYARWRPKARI